MRDMTETFAFEHCPLRNSPPQLADRSALVRAAVRTVWPAARRAERVELSDDGIAAWSLGGFTRLHWSEITSVRHGRTLLGRETLRIQGSRGRMQIAPILPGFD